MIAPRRRRYVGREQAPFNEAFADSVGIEADRLGGRVKLFSIMEVVLRSPALGRVSLVTEVHYALPDPAADERPETALKLVGRIRGAVDDIVDV